MPHVNNQKTYVDLGHDGVQDLSVCQPHQPSAQILAHLKFHVYREVGWLLQVAVDQD